MLNVLAVAGFMTFWAKCNTRTFQGGAEAASGGRRPRSNATAQGPSLSHEALLQRLRSLEDVVYRQLNGNSNTHLLPELPKTTTLTP